MTYFNCMAMPNTHTNYSYHIKAVELVYNLPYGVHSMPNHATSYYYPWSCTDIQTYTHAHCRQDEYLETRHAPACGRHVPSLKIAGT